MITYLLMGGISLSLLALLVLGAKYMPTGNDHFFDQLNSKAMRGFWCIIVVLVHVPQAYQNPIQDLISSFGYIGVTFFFMTSAYGLSLGTQRKAGPLDHFWLRRLPKLLVPSWVTNVLFALIFFVIWKERTSIFSCLGISSWVKWLLVCYLVFWIGHVVNPSKKHSMAVIILLTIVFSGSVYLLKHIGMVYTTTWCTEVLGFIWGVVLFSQFEKITRFFQKRWITKVLGSCFLSLVLGVLYLMFKNSIFLGDYALKIVLGLSILCFILILNSKVSIGNKVSWFLGDISFEIYLVHDLVFDVLSQLLPGISSGAFILLSVLASVLSATIVHKISSAVLKLCTPFINKQLSR